MTRRTRHIETTIDIAAPPATVWAVLTDTAAYPEWNPFVRELTGPLAVGQRVRVRIGPPGRRAMTLRPRIVTATEERELSWLGRLFVPGLFDGRHTFVLEPLPGGRTRFVQSEEFRGVLVPFVGRLLAATSAGFDAMNDALGRRSEEQAAAAPAASRPA